MVIITWPHRTAGTSDESSYRDATNRVCVRIAFATVIVWRIAASTVNTLSISIKAAVVEWQLKPDRSHVRETLSGAVAPTLL